MNCHKDSMRINHVIIGSKDGTCWTGKQSLSLIKPCRVAILVRDRVTMPSSELKTKIAHLIERIAYDVLCSYNDLQYIKGVIVQLLKMEFDGLGSGMVYCVVREGNIDFVVDSEKEVNVEEIAESDKRALKFTTEKLCTGTSIEWESNNCHLASVCLTGFMCTAFLFPKMKSETEA